MNESEANLVTDSIQALHKQLTEQNKHLRAELEKAREELAKVQQERDELKRLNELLRYRGWNLVQKIQCCMHEDYEKSARALEKALDINL